MGLNFDEHHAEMMRDNPEYRDAYDRLAGEFDLAAAMIDARQPANEQA